MAKDQEPDQNHDDEDDEVDVEVDADFEVALPDTAQDQDEASGEAVEATNRPVSVWSSCMPW